MNLFKSSILILISTCIISSNTYAKNVVEKRLNYTIVLPDKANNVQKIASSELKKFLQETYSEPISLNGKTSDITFTFQSQDEDFAIALKNNTFTFLGKDDNDVRPLSSIKRQAQTLSATYYFITKYLGTSFFFPGKDGYKITKNKKIVFSDDKDIPKPSFNVRSTNLQYKGYSESDSILFTRRLLGNLPSWARHDNYYVFLNKWRKRFEKTHPEYFGLYDGKRVSKKYPYHAPCFSNPAVIKQTVDDINASIKANPNIKSVKIFADCPIRFCECKNCKALPWRKYIGEKKENGEMVYGISNKIINEVRKTYPNIQLLTQTKKYTGSGSWFKAPQSFKMGPTTTVEHLTNRPLPKFNHDDEVAIAKQWQKNGVKITLKSYERYPAFSNYIIFKPHNDQKFFKMFLGIADGTRYSGAKKTVDYSLCALGEYLQMKMLFDINLDINAEILKFCKFAYPGAENEMVEFYSIMESLFAQQEGQGGNMLIGVYKLDNLKKPMQLLDMAKTKVNGNSKYLDSLIVAFKDMYNKSKKEAKVIDDKKNKVPFKTIKAPIVSGIDISKNPAKWAGATKEPFTANKQTKNFQKANAYLAHDTKNLYIGLVAQEEKSDQLMQKATVNHEGRIWADDCFEIMLVPNRNTLDYYQILVNSLGVYRVFKCSKGKSSQPIKDFKITTNSKINKGSWYATVAIPLEQFSKDSLAKKWKFNIFRTRVLKDSKKESRQSSGLRLLNASYHNLADYQDLAF